MSNRDNKAAAAEFRQPVGVDFDEFIRQAPIKLLLALAKFAEPGAISGPEVSPDVHLRNSDADVPSQIAGPVGSNRSVPCPTPFSL